jgi:hypothetical protein
MLLIQPQEKWGLRKSFGQAEKTELNLLLKLALVQLENKTLISAAIRDVTDKKKAESEIAAQNKSYNFKTKN